MQVRRPRPSSAGLAVVAASVLLLGGCGSSTVAGEDLAEQVSSQLAEQVGQEPDSVDCPEDLDAEEGATTSCTLTAGEATYDVAIEVTSVDDDQVSFDIAVADQPQG